MESSFGSTSKRGLFRSEHLQAPPEGPAKHCSHSCRVMGSIAWTTPKNGDKGHGSRIPLCVRKIHPPTLHRVSTPPPHLPPDLGLLAIFQLLRCTEVLLEQELSLSVTALSSRRTPGEGEMSADV